MENECKEALHHLRAAPCQVPTLHAPKLDQPFHRRSNASRYAIEAIVEQVDEGTQEYYALAMWFRKLAAREMQLLAREQEIYAIICALKKYQLCLGRKEVKVLTIY